MPETKTAPVLFVTFNRPDLAGRVFETIRSARPEKLYFASDGPRHDHPDDIEKITALRNMVLDGVDWPCEMKTFLRDVNKGLPSAHIEAMTWFFEQEEAGIVLEDDTLPSKSFFRFCTDLLEKYKYDERIMHICGFNIFGDVNSQGYSYYFSNYGHIWGWASWRRAWKMLDYNLSHWPIVRSIPMPSSHPFTVMRRTFENVWNGKSMSGLNRWYYSIALNSGLFIIPQSSLVTNIGFRDDATNFKERNNPYAAVDGNELDFPIVHPDYVLINYDYEERRVEEKKASEHISIKPAFFNMVSNCLRKIKSVLLFIIEKKRSGLGN